MSIGNLLAASARQYPLRIAVATGDKTAYTYSELAGKAGALAAGLRARGIERGQRVAIAMNNCADYFVVQFAAWFAGCIIVPVNAKLHAREMTYILDNCSAAICFSSGTICQELAREGTGNTLLVDIESSEFAAMQVSRDTQVDDVRPDDPAWLFYTSGTTGRPKGATLTHRNLLFMTYAYFADVDRVEPTDTMIHPAPLSHGAGLYALSHFAMGAATVIPESGGFDVAEIYALLDHWRGVSFFAAPTMVVRLLREFPQGGTPNLKTLIYGGAPMYVSDALEAVRCFGPRLFHLYGQGETPMTITGLPKRLHVDDGRATLADELGSCGFPRTGVEVRIVDEAGRELAQGEIGEVTTRSDCVMTGYWGSPAATQDALRGGWLHTGDVGCIDERGMLVLKDRSKDLIISGGTNIYPREIEEVLLRHPAVRECAVIGAPDPEWGENVVAFVVAEQLSETLATELDQACIDSIARFKRPKQYRFCTSLPKNAYGKVLKTELRKLL
jgi:acyl-CoA synthetase (AMP-forming)/AMP-acid ligase II